jgi:KDO2-lipid IV(A) lauroyltransferase
VEFIRLPEIRADPDSHPIHWEGIEHLEKAARGKTGVILIAAHFANWELLGAAIKSRFANFTAIARPMRNPFVENWLKVKRGDSGMDIILHRNAVRASLKWIKSGNIIGILVDQNLYTGGEFVDFFGRPAATTTLPAILHARTGAPVIITYSLREKNGYRFIFETPVNPPAGVSEAEQVKAHTQEISNRIEKIIRHHPENWFWIHNRWKRKV